MRVILDELSGLTPGDSPDDGLDDAGLARRYEPPRLPWLRANMVGSVDGAATGSDGRSGSVNNAADKRVFGLLRAQCDAVVVGAGTARAEEYGPAAVPIVLVSRRGDVPPRLAEGPVGSALLVTCAAAPGLAGARAALGHEQVLVLGDDDVEVAALPAALHARGLRSLLCEGGPHLLADLLAAGVVDELCSTTVPRLFGGDHPRITAGPDLDVALRLGLLLEEGGTLLARWLVDR